MSDRQCNNCGKETASSAAKLCPVCALDAYTRPVATIPGTAGDALDWSPTHNGGESDG